MADDDEATATATTAVTFRRNHLVRLRGFNHIALDGKLVRIKTNITEATGKFEVAFLDDQARPPVEVVPARRMPIGPKHFIHACEYCLVAASAAVDGGRLQMCGRCKTARYCNAECQRADWARHKEWDCFDFSHTRGWVAPLQQACIRGTVTEVRRLVEEEGADVDKASSNGPTPLTTAAYCGHLSVVQYLVEQGADVDKARATCHTPLFGASMKGFLPIVRYLVEQGADKEKTANEGVTPLFVAALQGHLAVVQYLAEQGADKEKVTDDGSTPLYIAAFGRRLAVVQYLAEHGADIDKATNDGITPLMMAAHEGHFQVVQCLLEHGADKNKATEDGTTPLFIAAVEDHLAVVQYLVEQGADIDRAIDKGHPAVELGRVEGDGALAAYLSAAGYDEEVSKDSEAVNGATALWTAAWKGHVHIVQYLVEHGANINKATSAGTTPLMVAEAAGHAEVAAYLRVVGAL